MTGRKIVLDTNSYLRLACTIHPLLSEEFGAAKNCLYVCPQFEKEYSRGSRIKTKFEWVNEVCYIENRKRKITVSRKETKEFRETTTWLLSHVLDMNFPKNESTPSKIDLEVLAIGIVLNVPVVTDDRAMHRVADEFGIETLSTLELLKLMFDCEYLKQETIISVVEYWHYLPDVPAKFKSEWNNLFGWDYSA